MSRITSANTGIQSEEEFHSAIKNIARIELEIQELETLRDQKIDDLKEDTEEQILQLKKSMTDDYTRCHSFATVNRQKVFFGRAKTAENDFAKYGFRKNPAKLDFLPGHNEDSVIQKAKELGLAVVFKIKKTLLKSELKKLSPEQQKTLGVIVTQREEFFVKPKAESLQS